MRPTADALFCLGLYPAAEVGADLQIDGAVDARLLSNTGPITRLFKDWWPSCRMIGVTCDGEKAAPAEPASGRGTALFFSGGVDSSYSLVSSTPRLGALITVLGVDAPLADTEASARLEALCRDTAAAKGLVPIVIETNVKEVFHPYAGWIEHHGSVLAAIGHMLSGDLERVLIASSGNELTWHAPWGSHPALDPLFSSAAVEIEHHGLVSRFDKIAAVAKDERLIGTLRVCNRARHNCGVCDKCTFAMRCLDILGETERATSFPPFTPRRGHLKIVDDAFRSELERMLEAALEAGRTDLVDEIRKTLATYRRQRFFKRAGIQPWRSWSRVMRHRTRWNKAAR